jgi:hypothetical protein
MPSTRRFPPPWTIDEHQASFIAGAKPSVAQKPQATDAAPHGDGDERGNAS